MEIVLCCKAAAAALLFALPKNCVPFASAQFVYRVAGKREIV